MATDWQGSASNSSPNRLPSISRVGFNAGLSPAPRSVRFFAFDDTSGCARLSLLHPIAMRTKHKVKPWLPGLAGIMGRDANLANAAFASQRLPRTADQRFT